MDDQKANKALGGYFGLREDSVGHQPPLPLWLLKEPGEFMGVMGGVGVDDFEKAGLDAGGGGFADQSLAIDNTSKRVRNFKKNAINRTIPPSTQEKM